MKEAIKDKWVKALRSGGYDQGKGKLRDMGIESISYCCLGVLADIYTIEKGCEFEDGAFLHDVVQQWAGVKDPYGTVFIDGNRTTLAILNDKLYYDFNKIADTIEEQWEEL